MMSRNFKRLISWILVTLLFALFFILYTCSRHQCFGGDEISALAISDYEAYLRGQTPKHSFREADLNKARQMDFEGEDVIVYLHVQKTSGINFGNQLVENLNAKPPCTCYEYRNDTKCDCLTKNNRLWLFSRHSVGWQCGLHADWTELNDCVDGWFKEHDGESRKKRRYHYITVVRDPVLRFLSEWRHVQRGGEWIPARLHCNGRDATKEEVPPCFEGPDWTGVSFEDFFSCKSNLAFNRMTRMLSNLSKVNCYDRKGLSEDWVNKVMLESAKENLMDFAFFGLVDDQKKTQFLFERTFGLKFFRNLKQSAGTAARLTIPDGIRERIMKSNKNDILLYQFAKDLFYQRVKAMEEHLGYTVKEYFSHIRDEEDS